MGNLEPQREKAHCVLALLRIIYLWIAKRKLGETEGGKELRLKEKIKPRLKKKSYLRNKWIS